MMSERSFFALLQELSADSPTADSNSPDHRGDASQQEQPRQQHVYMSDRPTEEGSAGSGRPGDESYGSGPGDRTGSASSALVTELRQEMQQEMQRQMEERTDCQICQERERSVVLQPCGHFCICQQCAQNLQPPECPLCRQAFTDWTNAIFS